MGKVKEFIMKKTINATTMYQFPMGKVKKRHEICYIPYLVSIPYGKGKGNTSRRVLVSWSLVYQFPMGKVKVFCGYDSIEEVNRINSLWER